MVKQLRLRILRRHIKMAEEFQKTGKPGVATTCPLTQALKEHFPKAASISTSQSGAFLSTSARLKNHRSMALDCAKDAAQFITDFDNGKHPKPQVGSLIPAYTTMEQINEAFR